MNCLINSIHGKKTYLVAVAAFIALFMAWKANKIDDHRFAEDATALVLAVTIRHGVTSNGPQEPAEDDPEAFLDDLPDDVKDDINKLVGFLHAKKDDKPPTARRK